MMLSTATPGTQIKFTPVVSSDTMVKNGVSKEITTKLMCMTAMQQYQSKSLEELRVEDYQANRKFPTAGSTTSVFGSSGTSSAFGTSGSTPGFGSATSNAFGSGTGTSNAFGGGTSLFGGNQQQTGTGSSLFGNTAAQKPSIFGGASTPAIGSSLFGSSTTTNNQQSSGSLFGNTAQKPAGSLFGSTASKPAGSLFGGTPTAATGSSLFGGGTAATSQPSTGLFGQTQPAAGTQSSFFGGGSTTTPAFGATNTSSAFGSTTGGSLFGGTQNQPAAGTTNSLFGGTTAKPSIFGGTQTSTPAIGGSLFGGTSTTTTQPMGGGIFGNTAQKPAGSLFGNTAPKPFGTTTGATTGSIFGNTAANTQQPSTGFFSGSTFGQQPVANQPQQQQSLITQQPIMLGGDSSEAAIRQAIIESQLSMYPYGDSQLLRSFSLKSDEESVKEAVKQQMEKERQNDNYFALKLGKQDSTKEPDSGSKRYQQSVLSAGRPSVFNYKPLVKRDGFAATDLSVSADTSQATIDQAPSLNESFKIPKSNLFVPSLGSLSKKRDNPKHLDLSVLSDVVPENGRSARLSSIAQAETEIHTSSPLPASINIEPARNLDFDLTASPQPRVSVNERSPANRTDTSFNDSLQHLTTHNISQEDAHDMTIIQGPAGVVLSKRDIFTEPPFEELDKFVKDGKVHLVDGFVIGRLGYGRIEWTGPIAFSDIDLGNLVRFQRKQIVVYPDETKKPPIGEGFNRKAIITLENIFPYNKQTKEEIRDPLSEEAQAFSRILERKCLKMDCDFLEYDAEKGTWVFRVKHF